MPEAKNKILFVCNYLSNYKNLTYPKYFLTTLDNFFFCLKKLADLKLDFLPLSM